MSAGRDHAEAVATVLAAFGKLARAGIDQADGLKDKDTADLFTEISRGVGQVAVVRRSALAGRPVAPRKRR